MIFIRRRYYIWLIKAYFKRWKRTIVGSLVIGAFLFFAILLGFRNYIEPLLQRKVEKVGLIGIYSLNNLPEDVLYKISFGLTTVDANGEVKPAAAKSWEIKDNGKTYIFYLREDIFFDNGEKLTSDKIELSFKDVKKNIINPSTISYTLKNPYAPFIATVAKPIFTRGLAGLGEFKVTNIDLNSGFVRSITLDNKLDYRIKKIIYFYPTTESLKIAFTLGEVEKIEGLEDLNIKNSNLEKWNNVVVTKNVNHKKLVALFYNNNDNLLSNKKIRQALSYALPDEFDEGQRAYSSILPESAFFNESLNYQINDVDIAKTYIESANLTKKDLKIEITTTKEYEKIAEKIAKSWKKIGIETKIKISDDITGNFQVQLYPFKIPKDPDQYVLWHSDQQNNIAHYKNLRIDKLLEDGRKTDNLNDRIKIYRDFQKYMLDDVPASILYFPYTYSLERRLK